MFHKNNPTHYQTSLKLVPSCSLSFLVILGTKSGFELSASCLLEDMARVTEVEELIKRFSVCPWRTCSWSDGSQSFDDCWLLVFSGYGTTHSGYGTTPVWCRGGSRSVEECWGFRYLKIKILNPFISIFQVLLFISCSCVISSFILHFCVYYCFQKCRYTGFQHMSNLSDPWIDKNKIFIECVRLFFIFVAVFL